MIDIRWKILSILFLILVKSSESLDIPKCCPEDEGLVFNGSYYLCSSENFFKTAPLKLGFSKDDQFIEKFPENCEEIIAIPYEPALKLPFNYCLDKMMNESDGKIVVLHCEEQASSWKHSNLTLRSVNKCCEIDEIFDPKYFRCLKSSNSTSLFINFVSGENVLLNINSGLPECVNPKVMMTYSSDDFKLLINSEDDIELVGDGKKINLKANEFCIDDTNEESLVVRSCRPGCEYGICVNKCCPEGQTFSLSSCSGFPQCVENKEFGFRPKYYNVSYQPIIEVEPPGPIGIKQQIACKKGKYPLNPNQPGDDFKLDIETGLLKVASLNEQLMDGYCLEYVDSKCETTYKSDTFALVCFPEDVIEEVDERWKYWIYSIGMVISCIFLALTLIVYIALPALQNFHGKTLMCYLVSSLVAYFCLSYACWPRKSQLKHCKLIGYSIYFAFLSAFSWLNIMCLDIWWTFGNVRSVHGLRKSRKELKKFLLFCLYSYGLPIILTLITYLFDHYDVAPGWLDGNIGNSQCWFATRQNLAPVLILFILPVGIQIFINLVLFILTIKHCNKVKSEIQRMQAGSKGETRKKRFLSDKAKLAMNTKLFIVMGISWAMEIVSAVCDLPDKYFFLPDTINVLLGVPIFCILILKKKVYYLMMKRLGINTNESKRKSDVTGTVTTSLLRSISSDYAKRSSEITSSS